MKSQDRYYDVIKDIAEELRINSEDDIAILREIARDLAQLEGWQDIYDSHTGNRIYTTEQGKIIKEKYREHEHTLREYNINSIINGLEQNMTEEEKYKTIFNWFINKCRYDYATLDETRALNLGSENRNKFRKYFSGFFEQMPMEEYSKMSYLNKTKAFLDYLEKTDCPDEIIKAKRKELLYLERAEKFKKSIKRYKVGDIFITKLGVCNDFAQAFKELCDKVKLKCEVIKGSILSDGVECGHAWNAIVINGKVRYIDISSAIHCKDGTDRMNNAEDFFNVSYEKLLELDNGKNRSITDESRGKIDSMTSGWNYDD